MFIVDYEVVFDNLFVLSVEDKFVSIFGLIGFIGISIFDFIDCVWVGNGWDYDVYLIEVLIV